MNIKLSIYTALVLSLGWACNHPKQEQKEDIEAKEVEQEEISKVTPDVTTELVKHDTDDPAIWINPENPEESLIVGTDKGGDDGDGALFVFNLEGKILRDKTIENIARPNNVDIAYGLNLNGKATDIAVCTERYTNSLRIFSLPEMKPVDNGGIEIFKGEELRGPMGISMYTDPATGNIYAIAGRKDGPKDGTYLWQYLLEDDGNGNVKGTLVRKFGSYAGREIEAIAVDSEKGYVYYSDEGVGVKKYYAHPDSSNVELALFGNGDLFTEDNEGISIYKHDDGTGYIIVSDQAANIFHFFTREGSNGNPHEHKLVKSLYASTLESDGNEVTSVAIGEKYPEGFFVAMSDDKTFQIYDWRKVKPEEAQITAQK
ncbi:phytase [Fulvivirga sediminis]|uniref:Phytase n=1 Tax=Fulvivirga sediminis TaxID=2803949 RepID=A0A937FBP5_9BACT|nr:phytase [Fulvivirga sediminis]MBL3657859.1 phytase [Fulvivirga sediminis]